MRKLSVLLACMALAGCVKVNSTPLGLPLENRGAIPASQVAVYRTANQVPGKYREVAMLNATGSSSWTNESGMNNKMRQKAGKMGANAIILDAMSEPGAGAKVAGAIFGVDVKRKGQAIAIYVYPASMVPAEGSADLAESRTAAIKEDTQAATSTVGESTAPRGAVAIVTFEDGSTLFTKAIAPAGRWDIKVTLMDGTNRFVGVNKVTRITDSAGVDQTAQVIDERKSLPR